MGISAYLVATIIGSIIGFLSGRVVRRFASKKLATVLLAIIGLLALFPFGVHYIWVIDYASSYGAAHSDQPVGMYSALRAFQIYVPIAAVIWSAAIVVGAWRFPFITGMGSLIFFIFYWSVGLRSLTPPDLGVRLDNLPTILLSILSLGLSAFGVIFALTISGSKPVNTSDSSDNRPI